MAYQLGAVYADKDQYDKVTGVCTKALELNPKCGGAYSNGGSAYYLNDQYDNLWEEFYRAQKSDFRIPPQYPNDCARLQGDKN